MTRARRAAAVAGLALLLSACGGNAPLPPTSGGTPPTETPGRAEPSVSASADARPARPFDAETLLAALGESRRPGGVPDVLETEAVADELAAAIWTIDGRPWSTLSTGGSCGPSICTLEIGGAHDGAEAEDVWTFTVAPETGSVEVASATLRSLPRDLVAELDELARSLDPLPDERNLILGAARWLPPPDDGTYVMSYRSGDESGCSVELTIDVAAGRLIDETTAGC